MATAAEVMQGLDDLSDFYGRPRLTENQCAQWYKKLKWLDKRDFSVAVEDITSHEKYFPTPAKILEFAGRAKEMRGVNERRQDQNQAKNFFNPRSHNSPLAKACVEFIDCSFKLKGVDKMQFELEWCEQMMKDYSGNIELRESFRKQASEVRKKLKAMCEPNYGNEVVNG